MSALNILICSGDQLTEEQLAQAFVEDGVKIQTTQHLIKGLYSAEPMWDFIVIDLHGITNLLRGALPAIRRRFPTLPVIGVWTKSYAAATSFSMDYGLELDAYLSEVPRTEDLIIHFPQVAAKFQGIPAEFMN